MKKMSLKTITAAIALICLLNSCQKEKFTNDPIKEPVNILNRETSIQQIFSRTQLVFAALSNGTVSYKNEGILSCATISTDSSSMPCVTVIDYGTSGCAGDDGITRKGKVVISFDGDYREAGVSVITTFSHYYENNDEITGSDTLRNIGLNGSGNTTLAFSINYDKILANNAGTEKDIFNGTREWLTGVTTQTIDDDQFGCDFIGYVTPPSGELQVLTSTSQIIYNMTPGCSFYPVKGTLISHRESHHQTVDFGDGTCDDLVDITEEGITTTHSLTP